LECIRQLADAIIKCFKTTESSTPNKFFNEQYQFALHDIFCALCLPRRIPIYLSCEISVFYFTGIGSRLAFSACLGVAERRLVVNYYFSNLKLELWINLQCLILEGNINYIFSAQISLICDNLRSIIFGIFQPRT